MGCLGVISVCIRATATYQRWGDLSTWEIQKMVQALPQYNEQMEKLSLHVEIAGKINKIIRDEVLRDLGQVEQDLVFSDSGTKEVINFLRMHQVTLGIYIHIHTHKT
ncbi:putative sec1-like protein [Helianthus annuus]|nr:putative sec1-like protein [Helianthus annuus]KAJ0617957.1 putative sec1-like protein [Helianthus annuus]